MASFRHLSSFRCLPFFGWLIYLSCSAGNDDCEMENVSISNSPVPPATTPLQLFGNGYKGDDICSPGDSTEVQKSIVAEKADATGMTPTTGDENCCEEIGYEGDDDILW